MKKAAIVFLFLTSFVSLAFAPPARKLKIFLVGDSTMSEKRVAAYPETGWGMIFSKFFDTATTVVYNCAQNGRSTKSFLQENRWTPIVDSLAPGDIVLIQFGHNDEVRTKPASTTEEEFQTNLIKYITDTRAKSAVPVLLTPVARRAFDSTGNLIDTHAAYSALVRQVAVSNKVQLIDLDKLSQSLLKSFGPDNSKLLYLHLDAGQHPNYPEGKSDNTHFNELGARKVAELVYAAMMKLNPGDIITHFYKPIPKI